MRKIYGECALITAVGIIIRIIMLGLLLTGSAGAATLTVCKSGCTYSSVQDAVDASSNQDTIVVQSGTYYENVNVNKQLTLLGIGMPVVDANGSGSTITLSANGVRLEGFTVTGAVHLVPIISAEDGPIVGAMVRFYTNSEAGIKVTSDNNTLISNNISNNGNGIFLGYSNSNNTLSDNNVSNNGNGIYLKSSNNNMIGNNNASNNDNYGIYLESSNNNMIGNNNGSNNDNYGIYLESSNNNTLNGNNISMDRFYGIYLKDSGNNTLVNNIITENSFNFGLSGNEQSDYNNQIDTSNLVNKKPIYYIKYAMNIVYDSSTNAGTFYCISCVNITIKDLNLSENEFGLFFWNTTLSKILNINVSNNNQDGIYLDSSSNNTLSGNYAGSNNEYGIYLGSSNNNNLSGNKAEWNGRFDVDYYNKWYGNGYGIFLISSSNNTLSGNNANSNFGGYTGTGIFLSSSSNNTLINNNVHSNSGGYTGTGIRLSSSSNNMLGGNNVSDNNYGIALWYSSSNNNIYNNFINNINNIDIGTSYSNTWNTTITTDTNIIHGPKIGGNFWANPNGTGFSQTCQDANGDGICDSSYMLDSNNIDHLPLASLNLTPTVITLTDDGKTITLQANESLLLKLGEDYDWNVTVDNQTVLGRVPNVLVIRGAQGIYRAHMPGNATLTATGDPICRKEQPPCGAPSRLFKLYVFVVTSPTAGDLNGNGISADAGDLVLMKRASIGEIMADSGYDLNGNGQLADAGDLVLMKRASIGEIVFPVDMT